MSIEEIAKIENKVYDAFLCISEIELQCCQNDKIFNVEDVDNALMVLRQMTEKYLESLKRKIPQRKLVCCPNCKMEVGIDETMCPWCSQVFENNM